MGCLRLDILDFYKLIHKLFVSLLLGWSLWNVWAQGLTLTSRAGSDTLRRLNSFLEFLSEFEDFFLVLEDYALEMNDFDRVKIGCLNLDVLKFDGLLNELVLNLLGREG